MHTHTHGGRSGHFDLSASHPPSNEVARKTAKWASRSHGLCHRGMLLQSHSGWRDGCSHASSAAVGLCTGNRRVEGGYRDYAESLLTKNEGPYPKKIVQKSRNSCQVNSGVVGAVDSELNRAQS